MIEEFAAAEDLAVAAVEAVLQALSAGLRRRGAAGLAATGGRSPGAVYDALSLAPLDWAQVGMTLTDERWVDPSSPDSNEGLVRRRLLQGRAKVARFTGLRGTADRIEDAASQASDALRGWPPLDVVLLGMGEDGHVASLFPGNAALPLGHEIVSSGMNCESGGRTF
jgi:6-phosphogluconolactonase